MFTRQDEGPGTDGTGGKAAPTAQLSHALAAPVSLRDRLSERLSAIDLAPDLSEAIGSRRWFRGAGTLVGLSALALAFWPTFAPLEAAPMPDLAL